jgi:hypothetical protein
MLFVIALSYRIVSRQNVINKNVKPQGSVANTVDVIEISFNSFYLIKMDDIEGNLLVFGAFKFEDIKDGNLVYSWYFQDDPHRKLSDSSTKTGKATVTRIVRNKSGDIDINKSTKFIHCGSFSVLCFGKYLFAPTNGSLIAETKLTKIEDIDIDNPSFKWIGASYKEIFGDRYEGYLKLVQDSRLAHQKSTGQDEETSITADKSEPSQNADEIAPKEPEK